MSPKISGECLPARTLLSTARRGQPPCPAEVRSLLEQLARDPPAGAWHPTGFVVLTLAGDDHGVLRLHVWPSGPRTLGRPCWLVHDHIWDLDSTVLCGAVENVEYRVAPEEDGDAQLYAVQYGAGRASQMERSATRVAVHEKACTRVMVGERYRVPAGDFHTTRVRDGEFAATLVVTRTVERTAPWVVGQLDAPAVVAVQRVAVERAVVGQLAVQVRERYGS